MAAKVRPLHNRLIIRRIDEDDKSAGGIIIPDSAKEKPQQGDVIAVGPGKRDDGGNVIKMDVQKGDRVLFSKYAGTEVTLDSDDHLIITEDDVLAVPEVNDNSVEATIRKGVRLTAMGPTLVAAHHRLRQGLEPVAPNPDLNHAGNFLYMLFNELPDQETTDLLDVDFILHAEHGPLWPRMRLPT